MIYCRPLKNVFSKNSLDEVSFNFSLIGGHIKISGLVLIRLIKHKLIQMSNLFIYISWFILELG